jgi:hypothetical protein
MGKLVHLFSRHAYPSFSCRHALCYNGTRSDDGIVADLNTWQNDDMSTKPNIFANFDTFSTIPLCTNGHAWIIRAVIDSYEVGICTDQRIIANFQSVTGTKKAIGPNINALANFDFRSLPTIVTHRDDASFVKSAPLAKVKALTKDHTATNFNGRIHQPTVTPRINQPLPLCESGNHIRPWRTQAGQWGKGPVFCMEIFTNFFDHGFHGLTRMKMKHERY